MVAYVAFVGVKSVAVTVVVYLVTDLVVVELVEEIDVLVDKAKVGIDTLIYVLVE